MLFSYIYSEFKMKQHSKYLYPKTIQYINGILLTFLRRFQSNRFILRKLVNGNKDIFLFLKW